MEKILKEFNINLDREGFSIQVKVVDRQERAEENLTKINNIINPAIAGLLFLGKTTEQIILTRSDKVEISIIQVEGLPWKYELAVFDDIKGKVTAAIRNDPLPGIEQQPSREAALERAVELLLIV
jgi:hypothetical protein